MKASSSHTRFPGRAGYPERQHHAAVMTTTIAHAEPRRTFDENDLPCHGVRRSRRHILFACRQLKRWSDSVPQTLDATEFIVVELQLINVRE